MKDYHVMLESKQTLSQESEAITVGYQAANYSEAWPGARTVCRLGTNHDDDNAKVKRRFYSLDEDGNIDFDAPISVSPAVYTVRRIFVKDTRKQGKKRMTTVDAETFLAVLDEHKIKANQKLKDLLTEVLTESGGARITVATARRLKIKTAETETGDDEAGAA